MPALGARAVCRVVPGLSFGLKDGVNRHNQDGSIEKGAEYLSRAVARLNPTHAVLLNGSFRRLTKFAFSGRIHGV